LGIFSFRTIGWYGAGLAWLRFFAWGCYFHIGADGAALKKTFVGMSYGALIAGVALALVVHNPVALPSLIAAPVYIAITVFFLVIFASLPLLLCAKYQFCCYVDDPQLY